jgi:hypothetical protein
MIITDLAEDIPQKMQLRLPMQNFSSMYKRSFSVIENKDSTDLEQITCIRIRGML